MLEERLVAREVRGRERGSVREVQAGRDERELGGVRDGQLAARAGRESEDGVARLERVDAVAHSLHDPRHVKTRDGTQQEFPNLVVHRIYAGSFHTDRDLSHTGRLGQRMTSEGDPRAGAHGGVHGLEARSRAWRVSVCGRVGVPFLSEWAKNSFPPPRGPDPGPRRRFGRFQLCRRRLRPLRLPRSRWHRRESRS